MAGSLETIKVTIQMSPNQKAPAMGCFHSTVIAHLDNGKVLMSSMMLAVGCQVVMIRGWGAG